MKRMLWVISIVSLIACRDNTEKEQKKVITDNISVEELEKKGVELFQNAPEEAVMIFKKLAVEYKQLKNFEKQGIVNLNITNIYDEHLNQLDSALVFAQKSLSIWKENNDSLQMANLYKYIGLLKGRAGDFTEAKSAIEKAVELYTKKNFDQGRVVSEFNLADICFREGNFRESESLWIKSKEFWSSKNNKYRIFTSNLLGIQLYDKMGSKDQVQSLIKENRAIAAEIKIDSHLENKFEKLVGNIEAGFAEN